MVKKRRKLRKEEIAEDWCFVCKDGGLLMVCDYNDCRKAYHPHCVGKDDSFLKNGSKWHCHLHFCYICRKSSKFRCLCCPHAVCGNCIHGDEFATVKNIKGFCINCSKLTYLIEENVDADSDGERVDFKDANTYEGLFFDYYEVIKEEEGLNSQHVYSAHRFFKNCKTKCDLDQDEVREWEDDTEDSEDGSSFVVSDSDDLNDTARSKSVRKKKSIKSTKEKEKDKRKEFIGWGSRSLIEFLKYIGKDTSKEFSESDVTSIIMQYCRENRLFDPQKKRKILCDAKLMSLLGRKSVNKNSIPNLLEPHFAENIEEMDDISGGSEDRDYNEPFDISRKRKLISSIESHHPKLVSEGRQNCFAAIVSSNLKLVYLKRSLVDELLKGPETFDGKVLGCYVRVKSDPYDYLQKNSHLLVQVVGINRSSKDNDMNQEIMLRLSNVPKDVPICKISDFDFSEEECQDLYQRMKNGLLKQPTVLELEQKARSLHEDIIKHWIPRELALLQNRIDQANEKGWRRELSQYLDQKLKLETPLEQSRLLNDIPNVIPEIIDTNLSPEGSPRKNNLEQNVLSELASGKTCNSGVDLPQPSGIAHSLNNKPDAAVETVAQGVENDRGVSTLSGSKTGGKKTKSNKEMRVYTRRNLHQKKVQPIVLTLEQIDSPETSPENVPGNTDPPFYNAPSQNKGTSKRKQPQSTSKARQDDPEATLFKKLRGLCRSGSGINGRNLSGTMHAKQTIQEKQCFLVADHVKVSVNGKRDTRNSAIRMEEKKFSISTTDVIVLSDDDEQEENVTGILSRRKLVENPEISIWHCVGPSGEKRGPFSLAALKSWSEETSSHPLALKVWKTGQSETEAIFLTDALNRFF